MESMAAAARRLRLLLRSTAVLYLLAAAFLLGSAGVLYSRFTFAAFSDSYTPPSPGCRPDGEGSWSIGLFYGESPLKLQPLELVSFWIGIWFLVFGFRCLNIWWFWVEGDVEERERGVAGGESGVHLCFGFGC